MSDEPARDIDDLATARTLITTLQDELTRVQRENASLRHQLDLLCQRLFGKKSERVSPDQLRLAFAQLANEPRAATDPIEMDSGERPGPGRRRRVPPPGRRPLPPALPRARIEIDIPEADKICPCGHRKTRIGEAVTEKLEYVPASLRVIETARLKYACARCHEGVVEAPAPPQALEKSLAGEGLLAHVVVSKYVDHVPLYRLERIFLRQGVDLSRTTLCGWVADVATALTPIGDELRRQVTTATYLQTDDTPVTILEPSGGSRKVGSGLISIRSVVRSSLMPHRRTNAMGPRRSSPPLQEICRRMRTPGTMRSMPPAACEKLGAGPMRVGALSKHSPLTCVPR